jgi:hypothetical protein
MIFGARDECSYVVELRTADARTSSDISRANPLWVPELAGE